MNTPFPPDSAPQNTSESLSRKERRILARQERKSDGAYAQRRRTARRMALWTGVVAVMALGGWGIARLAASVPSSPSDGQNLAPAVTAQDHSIGKDTAPLVLVEYSDFQCPACRAYQPLLEQLRSELGDSLRIVYRHFPLTNIHQNAEAAAFAAEAAALQGKFWEYHDVLFERQTAWSTLSAEQAQEAFRQYAKELSLNGDRLVQDMKSSAVRTKVSADAQSATQMRLPGTPTFFINGKLLPSPSSYDDFKRSIQSALPAA